MSAASYEAYCASCQVSHPPGTRHCMHCGGEVSKERPANLGAMRHSEATEIAEIFETGPGAPDDEEGTVRKTPGRMRVVISVLWIAFAIGISIYRGCQGGS